MILSPLIVSPRIHPLPRRSWIGRAPLAGGAVAQRVLVPLVIPSHAEYRLLLRPRIWLGRVPQGIPAPTLPRRILSRRASVGTVLARRASVGTVLARRASAMSVASNFTFFKGEDVEIDFTLVPPQDMTGWTLTSSVSATLGGAILFNPTVAITDAGRGLFKVLWPRGSTENLAAGDYVWDVRRTDSGKNTVLAHGEATCREPVTS